jgi:hypothetical protein
MNRICASAKRSCLLKTFCALPLILGANAQVNNSPLVYIETIAVPTWTNSGATQQNSDILAFNPLTHILYMADRANHSVDAFDTHSDTIVGVMPIPGSPSTNGALIAPDLQQLVVTDGKSNVYVYDLRLPGSSGPDTYTLPNIGGGTDALDYDPLNHTVYVINGTAPYYITGIDLVRKTIASQYKLPGSPELMRFNPVDGLIYQVITDGDNKNAGAGVAAYDPVANMLKPTYLTPNCVPHGIEIDAVTDTALLGCGTNQGQTLMDLKTGKVLMQFAEVTGSDLISYNPNTRRFYTGSASNVSTAAGCPADSTGAYPVIGVFDAKGPATAGYGELIGAQCSGRNTKGPGIDPLQNLIYVATRQFPVDSGSATTGQPGLLVFWDPSGPTQPATTYTQATLGSLGSVTMAPRGRAIHVHAMLTPASGRVAIVNITTTVGNEVASCGIVQTGPTICDADLVGDPLIGGSALLGVDGAPVAQGTITGN